MVFRVEVRFFTYHCCIWQKELVQSMCFIRILPLEQITNPPKTNTLAANIGILEKLFVFWSHHFLKFHPSWFLGDVFILTWVIRMWFPLGIMFDLLQSVSTTSWRISPNPKKKRKCYKLQNKNKRWSFWLIPRRYLKKSHVFFQSTAVVPVVPRKLPRILTS